MDQVEQPQKCGKSSSCIGVGGSIDIGGVARSSKNPKQKKAPQRGLGVAQLEKIRLEEQQKKDAILSSPPSVSPTKSSFISLPIPNYHHSNPSSSSIPFHSPSPAHLSSLDSMIRPPQPVQNIDVRNSSTVSSGGFEAGWSGISVPGYGCVPKLWNTNEYDPEKESSGLDPGLAFRSNLNLPYESDNHFWLPPSLMQRTQQYQHPSHSMVNVSSGTSSSSVLSFQMEPPSNQSYYGNYTTSWSEEEKMVGMKRPYPFFLDDSPGPPFNYKLHTLIGSDKSASSENGGQFNFKARKLILREGPSSSISYSKMESNTSIKGNEVLKGKSLSLSPPRTTPTCRSSKLKPLSACLALQDTLFPDFESLPYQGTVEDPIIQQLPSQLDQQQPFYCFLPPAKVQIGQATTTMNNCNGVGESIDLNLKL
ncbi:hypothetical protein F2P56_020769 [Juglans regia]|uniref:Protein SPEAR2-like n=2 Tax=Juglans regia TaxID=51240 RepID=A0A833UWE8_JUGRE|nr:uncharacterized protein LOC108992536 [Juglans regia]KAF5460935.1 hypothetical protein F2P56_020769 [Juglans regia]